MTTMAIMTIMTIMTIRTIMTMMPSWPSWPPWPSWWWLAAGAGCEKQAGESRHRTEEACIQSLSSSLSLSLNPVLVIVVIVIVVASSNHYFTVLIIIVIVVASSHCQHHGYCHRWLNSIISIITSVVKSWWSFLTFFRFPNTLPDQCIVIINIILLIISTYAYDISSLQWW